MGFINNHKLYWKNKNWLWLSVTGAILLFVSFVVSFYAGRYANSSMSSPVTDIILSNIRSYDVDTMFIYGPLIFWAFVIILCLLKPTRIPFITKSVAVFVIIRSVFISLTHVAVFPSHLIISAPNIFGFFSYYGDLFFSAHTGLPFLLALIFWDNKYFRIIFIATAIFFGIIVLLGHLHYSIDVLGAFFITYTIYQISAKIFKRDKALFDQDIQSL